ncbi:MAG: nucleoside 2-deoxyribosyltransferase [Desulfatibacillum sp.]|nr:nucleoside 2-deoxyribosyltransferase [Desulfatibacillum sp.]
MVQTKRRVYCSGPLFNPEEQWGMEAIAATLEKAGYDTFLPQRDGLEKYVMGLANDPKVTNRMFRRINKFVNRAIFSVDVYQILEGCDYLVFNMNGRVPDEGGVVETGIAFAAQKPLVIYKKDYRTKFNGSDNSMITGLSYTFSTVTSMEKIPTELERVARILESMGPNPYRDNNIPPHVKKVLSFGRTVWKFLSVARFFDADDAKRLDLLDQLAAMCEESPAMARLQKA